MSRHKPDWGKIVKEYWQVAGIVIVASVLLVATYLTQRLPLKTSPLGAPGNSQPTFKLYVTDRTTRGAALSNDGTFYPQAEINSAYGNNTSLRLQRTTDGSATLPGIQGRIDLPSTPTPTPTAIGGN